jgi:hypothetical protein
MAEKIPKNKNNVDWLDTALLVIAVIWTGAALLLLFVFLIMGLLSLWLGFLA